MPGQATDERSRPPEPLFHFLRNRCSTSSGFRVPLPPEYPFPPQDSVSAFVVKLLEELDAGRVTRAALLAPLDLTESWPDRILAHERLSLVVIDNGRGRYRLEGTTDTRTPAGRMTLFLFGINEPAAGLLDKLGAWGHVLLANGRGATPTQRIVSGAKGLWHKATQM